MTGREAKPGPHHFPLSLLERGFQGFLPLNARRAGFKPFSPREKGGDEGKASRSSYFDMDS